MPHHSPMNLSTSCNSRLCVVCNITPPASVSTQYSHSHRVGSRHRNTLGTVMQVCVQLPTSADNMTLLAVTDEHRRCSNRSISPARRPQQQTRRTLLDRRDGLTDTAPLHRPMRAVSIIQQSISHPIHQSSNQSKYQQQRSDVLTSVPATSKHALRKFGCNF